MSSESRCPGRASPITVWVQHHPRGQWEVLFGNGGGRISCETLDDARRIAYRSAGHGSQCELIVRDAYNRVLERDLIDDHLGGQAGSRSPASKPTPNPGGQ